MVEENKGFQAVYDAGKMAQRKSGWQFYVLAITGAVAWPFVHTRIAARYSLPWFEALLLTGLIVFLATVALSAVWVDLMSLKQRR